MFEIIRISQLLRIVFFIGMISQADRGLLVVCAKSCLYVVNITQFNFRLISIIHQFVAYSYSFTLSLLYVTDGADSGSLIYV